MVRINIYIWIFFKLLFQQLSSVFERRALEVLQPIYMFKCGRPMVPEQRYCLLLKQLSCVLKRPEVELFNERNMRRSCRAMVYFNKLGHNKYGIYIIFRMVQ